MEPYYFPFVTEAPDGVSGHLIGYFDARPKDTDESIVVAGSTDNGHTWTYEGTAPRAERGLLPPGRHERRRAGSSDRDQGRRDELPVHGEPAVGGQRRGRSPRASGEPLGEQPPERPERIGAGGGRPRHRGDGRRACPPAEEQPSTSRAWGPRGHPNSLHRDRARPTRRPTHRSRSSRDSSRTSR